VIKSLVQSPRATSELLALPYKGEAVLSAAHKRPSPDPSHAQTDLRLPASGTAGNKLIIYKQLILLHHEVRVFSLQGLLSSGTQTIWLPLVTLVATENQCLEFPYRASSRTWLFGCEGKKKNGFPCDDSKVSVTVSHRSAAWLTELVCGLLFLGWMHCLFGWMSSSEHWSTPYRDCSATQCLVGS
jgi:hypothetical protein